MNVNCTSEALLTEHAESERREAIEDLSAITGTFMGRDALALVASYLNLGAEDSVLLPVYTCQEVIQAFVNTTRVVFYDVQPDLTIDPDELESKLVGNRPKMLLITNYFGFLQPYRQRIKAICAAKGISLVEDCAHSLLTQGSGATGDLAVYSFRKILPLRDGGGLKIAGNQAYAPRYYPKLYANAISMLIAARAAFKLRNGILNRAGVLTQVSKLLPKRSAGPEKRFDRPVLPLSSFAKKSMSTVSMSQCIEKRRSDYHYWQQVCSSNSSILPVFQKLDEGVCPFGFPIRVGNRDLFESRARRAGIDLRVHWRLHPSSAPECTISHQLTSSLVTLPLYPELKRKHRELLTEIVTSY